MGLVEDQLAKVNPLGPGATTLAAVRAEQAAPAQAAAGGGETLAQESERLRAETDAAYAEQARLREKHGALGTVGLQGARGLLDTVLGSGALVGLAAEGAGTLLGADALRDFGRDLGTASSGKSAAEAAAFLFGGGGQEGLSASERVGRDIEEQERAHPLLSTVSRMAGQAALGLAAGPGAGAGATVGVLAAEGAGAGAQAAYEESAPLRDVLTSAFLGAGLGAAGGAAAHYGGAALASRAAGRAASAEEAALLRRALGASDDLMPAAPSGAGREAAGVVRELEAAREYVAKAAREAGPNPVVAAEAAERATEAAAKAVAAKAGPYDAKLVLTGEAPSGLQKVVHRKEILDEASSGLSEAVSLASSSRPALAFDISEEAARKLTKGADAVDSIGGLRAALSSAADGAPQSAVGDQVVRELRAAASVVDQAGVDGAFRSGHALAARLLSAAESAPDELSKSFATRAARSVMGELSGDQWGKAGGYYRDLVSTPSAAFEQMADPAVLRAALASSEYRGAVGKAAAAEAKSIALAHDARIRLSGSGMPREERKALGSALADLSRKFELAEEATTVDGKAAGKVLDWLKSAAEDKVLGAVGGVAGSVMGGLPGAALGYVVSNAIRPAVRKVVPALLGAAERGLERGAPQIAAGLSRGGVAAGRAAAEALSPEEEQERYRRRVDAAVAVQSDPDLHAVAAGASRLGLPPGAASVAASDYREKMANYVRDVPKPTPSVKGPAWETMSEEQVRLADAMWEATTRPLSVFDDFSAGDVDYDKVEYAWRQYPGMRQAAQAALQDELAGMSDEERGDIPDGVLSQVDYLLGYGGTLDPMLDRAFSQRVDAAEAERQKGAAEPGAMLDTGLSEPTFTQRVADGS